MSKFKKYIDEKCMGAYMSKADNKKKRKQKGKMEEGSVFKLRYNGVHVKDNLLDGITLEDLQDAVYSNLPKNKINPNTVQKEFNDMINSNLKDAKTMLKKIMKELVEDLTIEGDK